MPEADRRGQPLLPAPQPLPADADLDVLMAEVLGVPVEWLQASPVQARAKQETDLLNSIPGMAESIKAGMEADASQLSIDPGW